MPTRTFFTLLAVCALAVAAGPAAAHVEGGASPRAAVAQVPVQQPPEPALAATPQADCGPGSRPEPGMQGRVPREEVDSGRAADGYVCNLGRIGQSGATGGFRVHRYVDHAGRECAYYDTTLLYPTNVLNFSLEPTGVAVLDMSDPSRPVRTATLHTAAMQSPHESVNISVERGLLAASTGSPVYYPSVVDVYDISADCRSPQLLASAPVGVMGHESGMAPDGRTFYVNSPGSGELTAIDLTNPRLPLAIWRGDYDAHGMSVSDDGNRGYVAALSGLIILDLSEIQAREPNPRAREISRLTWSNMTIPQYAVPITVKGRPYLLEVDEFSTSSKGGRVAGNGPFVGAARIIDISDETRPFVVSNLRLEVHQPENRAAIAGDHGAQSVVQGYAGHYCDVPQRREPAIVACSMILSGLRVFDIRDPERPREVAYNVAPPSTVSETGSDYADEPANWAMSQPSFVPERREIWYSDGTSGFHALRLTEEAWPQSAAAGECAASRTLSGVALRGGRTLSLRLAPRPALPLRVDMLRVTRGRRVVRSRRVARVDGIRRTRTLRVRLAPGWYVVRVAAIRRGRAVATRSFAVRRTAAGRFVRARAHQRAAACTLLRSFRLDRPVFGGSRRAPLRATYRLRAPSRVTITVRRGRRVVRRFATRAHDAGTFTVRIPARGLRPGSYTVELHAVSGTEQVFARLAARRL